MQICETNLPDRTNCNVCMWEIDDLSKFQVSLVNLNIKFT